MSYTTTVSIHPGQAVPDIEPLRSNVVEASSRYHSLPAWLHSGRSWEAGETTRLNEAHWLHAADKTVNEWLTERLATVRERSIYETRNNPILSGVAQTLVDDVVGNDGPSLQVQSSDEAFNTAAERLWRQWFAAPTPRPNVSGAALLRLWVRNLPRCGEFIATLGTVRDAAGIVKMRVIPVAPRRLASPSDRTGNSRLVLGVEFDNDDCDAPVRYWIARSLNYSTVYDPYPPDLVIHEFLIDEEGQARGFPWFTPSLQPTADLRDFDDQIQDAARSMADQSAMLYCENPQEVWTSAESAEVRRREYTMAPPGWKPWVYPATQPPVQYPDYRAEKQRDIGRPFSMPLMMIRLDASKHNYSSARFDGQGWGRFVASIQTWLSGSEHSYGTLNRLVDEVLREARFSVPELRTRPDDVVYKWTWPARPHVDPQKERAAQETGLQSRTLSLTDALAADGKSVETHVATLQRERKLFEAAGLPLPSYMSDAPLPGQAATPNAANDEPDEADEDTEEEEAAADA